MTQRAFDTVKCIQYVYSSTVNVAKLEPNNEYLITRNIAPFLGGKLVVPFFQIPSAEEDYLETMKSYFYLASQDTQMKYFDCFVLYVNIIRGSFPNLDKEIRKSLVDSGFECNIYTDEESEAWLDAWIPGAFGTPEYQDIEVNQSVIKVCIGIYWNFITKRLTAANIEGWLKKRRGAYYAAVSVIAGDDEALISLAPELGFADKVNQNMAACFPFKTAVFKAIRSLSNRSQHTFKQIADVTMVYFSMAELSGFALIYEWILLKNPILLAWEGLARHNAHMTAAVNVFKSLGEEAPYCKFLYPPEQLQVFQHSRLGVYVELAFEISMMEGKTSYKNYQGVSRTYLSPELSEKCRQIVTLFGGAKTKTSYALRTEILQDSKELSELQSALVTGLKQNITETERPDAPV